MMGDDSSSSSPYVSNNSLSSSSSSSNPGAALAAATGSPSVQKSQQQQQQPQNTIANNTSFSTSNTLQTNQQLIESLAGGSDFTFKLPVNKKPVLESPTSPSTSKRESFAVRKDIEAIIETLASASSIHFDTNKKPLPPAISPLFATNLPNPQQQPALDSPSSPNIASTRASTQNYNLNSTGSVITDNPLALRHAQQTQGNLSRSHIIAAEGVQRTTADSNTTSTGNENNSLARLQESHQPRPLRQVHVEMRNSGTFPSSSSSDFGGSTGTSPGSTISGLKTIQPLMLRQPAYLQQQIISAAGQARNMPGMRPVNRERAHTFDSSTPSAARHNNNHLDCLNELSSSGSSLNSEGNIQNIINNHDNNNNNSSIVSAPRILSDQQQISESLGQSFNPESFVNTYNNPPTPLHQQPSSGIGSYINSYNNMNSSPLVSSSYGSSNMSDMEEKKSAVAYTIPLAPPSEDYSGDVRPGNRNFARIRSYSNSQQAPSSSARSNLQEQDSSGDAGFGISSRNNSSYNLTKSDSKGNLDGSPEIGRRLTGNKGASGTIARRQQKTNSIGASGTIGGGKAGAETADELIKTLTAGLNKISSSGGSTMSLSSNNALGSSNMPNNNSNSGISSNKGTIRRPNDFGGNRPTRSNTMLSQASSSSQGDGLDSRISLNKPQRASPRSPFVPKYTAGINSSSADGSVMGDGGVGNNGSSYSLGDNDMRGSTNSLLATNYSSASGNNQTVSTLENNSPQVDDVMEEDAADEHRSIEARLPGTVVCKEAIFPRECLDEPQGISLIHFENL